MFNNANTHIYQILGVNPGTISSYLVVISVSDPTNYNATYFSSSFDLGRIKAISIDASDNLYLQGLDKSKTQGKISKYSLTSATAATSVWHKKFNDGSVTLNEGHFTVKSEFNDDESILYLLQQHFQGTTYFYYVNTSTGALLNAFISTLTL